MNPRLTIDSEFESLIQPLTAQELSLLTEQILRDGCREPLSVWKTEDDQRILLDGHNRYKICSEHKCDFQRINIKLDSREHAKLWILEHQVGRRNLTDDQRAVMWNEIRKQRVVVSNAEKLEQARATKAGTSTEAKTTPIEPKLRIRETIKKESGLSESKLRAIQGLEKTNLDLYKQVQSGARTIRDAKKSLQKKPPSTFSGTEYFHSIGTKIAIRDPRLKELLAIESGQWTPHVENGIRRLIENLKEVSKQADGYVQDFEKLLKRHGKKKAA